MEVFRLKLSSNFSLRKRLVNSKLYDIFIGKNNKKVGTIGFTNLKWSKKVVLESLKIIEQRKWSWKDVIFDIITSMKEWTEIKIDSVLISAKWFWFEVVRELKKNEL